MCVPVTFLSVIVLLAAGCSSGPHDVQPMTGPWIEAQGKPLRARVVVRMEHTQRSVFWARFSTWLYPCAAVEVEETEGAKRRQQVSAGCHFRTETAADAAELEADAQRLFGQVQIAWGESDRFLAYTSGGGIASRDARRVNPRPAGALLSGPERADGEGPQSFLALMRCSAPDVGDPWVTCIPFAYDERVVSEHPQVAEALGLDVPAGEGWQNVMLVRPKPGAALEAQSVEAHYYQRKGWEPPPTLVVDALPDRASPVALYDFAATVSAEEVERAAARVHAGYPKED
jgi:hypothetical protein